MSWQPRALKKRGAEFAVVTRGIGAPVADGAPAAAAASSSGFNGAADLEDLEDEKETAPETKRPKLKTQASNPDPDRDEVADGAPRLAAYIVSDAKFNKVAAMAFALLDSGGVTPKNAGAFFVVLEAAMRDPHRLRDKTYRVAYRKLFTAATTRASLFPASALKQLKLWEVHVLAQIELFTDDTFQFNRAAKVVRESLHGLPCVFKALEPADAVHLPEADRAEWVAVLFDCVEAAMQHHKYGWAKTTCDMLVKTIVDRRQNFSDEQQTEIQVWNAKCKGQKVMRQQEYASQRRDQTSFERKESEWQRADIANKKGDGGGGGGGLDGWCAKQSLN